MYEQRTGNAQQHPAIRARAGSALSMSIDGLLPAPPAEVPPTPPRSPTGGSSDIVAVVI